MAYITYKNDETLQEVTIKIADYADTEDFIDCMKSLFLAIGYHHKSWPLTEDE